MGYRLTPCARTPNNRRVATGHALSWVISRIAPSAISATPATFSVASYGRHAAAAEPGIVAREPTGPAILAEWSILWPERAQSAAITRFLDSARRCAQEKNWLRSPTETISV